MNMLLKQPEVKMITHNEMKKTVTLSNEALETVISYGSGISIDSFKNLNGGKTSGPFEAFVLEAHGRRLTSRDFSLDSVSVLKDETEELVTFICSSDEEQMKVRLHFISDLKDSISVLYQVWDDFKTGVPTVVYLHLPLLASLSIGPGEKKYYPAHLVSSRNGGDVVALGNNFSTSDILPPLVICDSEEKNGYVVDFPTESDLGSVGAAQNQNRALREIHNEEELRNHRAFICPDASFNDTIELKITGISGGWQEAFGRYRDSWRSKYEFSEYQKKDLRWFDSCVVNNFTFLFGEEGMNFKEGKVDVAGLIEQGKEYGGYDTVTVWNMYPRLGVDTKSQWDFYDNFSGGREALRDMVTQFHEAGIKVFMPYIPWDQQSFMSQDEMGDRFAQIIKDTDADGFQLDTLAEVPYSFRKKLDAIRPGIVLTTQSHPANKHPTEFITTSWDETWSLDPMPESDILRFLLPEHVAPVNDRWLRSEQKDVMIKRCEFGGAPIVIWQDIFGRWIPYTTEQKKRIARWKKCYLKYISCFRGSRPTPAYPTFTEDVYCNKFPDDAGKTAIYSFYNDSDEMKTVALKMDCTSADCVLGESEVKLAGNGIEFTIAPREVVQLLVK